MEVFYASVVGDNRLITVTEKNVYQNSNMFGGETVNRSSSPERGIISGRLDPKKLAVNLAWLGVLSTLITYCVLVIVDQILAVIVKQPPHAFTAFIPYALVCGAIGVLFGLLYVLVIGTGNEGLFPIAVFSLSGALIFREVLLGGLFDGNLDTITVLLGIISVATTASIAPSRVEAAALR